MIHTKRIVTVCFGIIVHAFLLKKSEIFYREKLFCREQYLRTNYCIKNSNGCITSSIGVQVIKRNICLLYHMPHPKLPVLYINI